MEQEEFRDIEGYDGLYQISDCGRVKSFKQDKINGKILKQGTYSQGYKFIALDFNGKQKWFLIHRLVGIAFIPNPENKPQINHKNGIKDDNNLSNLEWVTQSQNIRHRIDVLGI